MSYERALANLKALGQELHLDLAFDESNTCILNINKTDSLSATKESNSERILPALHKILSQ